MSDAFWFGVFIIAVLAGVSWFIYRLLNKKISRQLDEFEARHKDLAQQVDALKREVVKKRDVR